ncbi:MAG: Rho termination factor [Propionibacteriales bacterium]|nr:Rho termination factor [Propionibacteriales bacterium]
MVPARKTPGPSVKNDETYEALRDKGASKEKAARIANAQARDGEKAVGRRGGKAPKDDDMSKQELYDRGAKRVGLEGRSTMSKSQLIGALRNH